jgi:hypothetical protein
VKQDKKPYTIYCWGKIKIHNLEFCTQWNYP